MRIFFILAFAGLGGILVPLSLKAQGSNHTANPSYNDGPYIFYENGQVLARWTTKEGLQEKAIHAGQPLEIDAGTSASFDPSYLDVNDSFQASSKTAFNGVEHIAAVSDIHGQYDLLLDLLKAHRIIDESGNWAFGEGHLVVLGDIFDRGDEVTDLLWFVHNLEKQAEKANGQVHYLLGNHEIMALQGDLRYIHKKYRYTMARMGMPYNELFGENTYLGRWLRSKPVAISINKTAFVHAGFSEALLDQKLSFADMNQAFQEKIIGQLEDSIVADPILGLLYSEYGPVWYRGYFDEGFAKWQAQAILSKIRKKHIIVGHTSFSEIVSLFRNRIIGIDSSIKLGKKGEILLIDKNKFYRGTLDGERIRLK
ncbi:MAG: metallophosphoesterase [Phaeodactylibacter sp.]|nr:metallophosphoesterase [Phaeodactylibacter sp.]